MIGEWNRMLCSQRWGGDVTAYSYVCYGSCTSCGNLLVQNFAPLLHLPTYRRNCKQIPNWCSQRAPARKASEGPIDAVYKFEPSLDLFLKLWRYFSLPWPERGWSLGIGSLCSSREQGGRRFAWKVVKPTFHILEYGLTIKTSGTKSLVPPTPNQVGPCWMSPLMGTFPPNFIASPAS